MKNFYKNFNIQGLHNKNYLESNDNDKFVHKICQDVNMDGFVQLKCYINCLPEKKDEEEKSKIMSAKLFL